MSLVETRDDSQIDQVHAPWKSDRSRCNRLKPMNLFSHFKISPHFDLPNLPTYHNKKRHCLFCSLIFEQKLATIHGNIIRPNLVERPPDEHSLGPVNSGGTYLVV